jgi:flagellar hook-length control protein FliK
MNVIVSQIKNAELMNARKKSAQNSGGGSDFDAVFAQAQHTDRQPEQTRQTQETRRISETAETENNAQSTNEAEAILEEPISEIDSNEETAAIDESEVDEAYECAIEELAYGLEIPAEMIAAILAQMNAELADLEEPAIKLEFLAKAMDAETPADLLSVENILAKMEIVSEAVGAFAEKVLAYEEATGEIYKHMAEIAINDNLALEISGNGFEAEIIEIAEEEATMPNQQTAEHNATIENIDNPILEMGINQQFEAIHQAAQTAQTAQTANVNPQSVTQQIVDTMKLQVSGAQAEIHIKLNPEHLGDLTMRIATQNGIVTANFVAQNQRVKEIIESQFNQLRDALNAQGMEIAEINVSISDSDNSGENEENSRDLSAARIDDLIAQAMEEELPETSELGDPIATFVDTRA